MSESVRMGDMNAQFTPDYATPPGETLVEWLGEQAISHSEVARRLGMNPEALGQFLRGDTLLTSDLAQALDRVTDIIPATIDMAIPRSRWRPATRRR